MPTHHANDVPVDGLREDAPAGGDVVDDLVERGPLDLLALEVGHRVHEVEGHAALPQLPDEQLLLLRGRHICKKRKGKVIFKVKSSKWFNLLYLWFKNGMEEGYLVNIAG